MIYPSALAVDHSGCDGDGAWFFVVDALGDRKGAFDLEAIAYLQVCHGGTSRAHVSKPRLSLSLGGADVSIWLCAAR